MKIVEIIINPSGRLTINAAGFTGSDCEKATAFLEQALGEIQQRQHKAERYRQVRRQQRVGS